MLIKRLLACINLYGWIKSNTAKLQMIYQMVFLYSDLLFVQTVFDLHLNQKWITIYAVMNKAMSILNSSLQLNFIGARTKDEWYLRRSFLILSIIGGVYRPVWRLVMFAPIPLSLIFIKLFWAHTDKIKNEYFLMEMNIFCILL